MRKIIRFSIYLFISFTFILGISYLFSIGNENIEEEKIIKNENINTISYYANKYDLLNENNKIINIKETIPFSSEGVYYYSNNSKQDKLSIDLTIDKNKSNIELEYDVISDKLNYSDYYTLDVVLIGDEIYIVSRYDYVLLPNIDINKENVKFGAFAGFFQSLFYDDFLTIDGQSSIAKGIGAALVPVAIVAVYAVAESKKDAASSCNTTTQASTTVVSQEEKINQLNDKMLHSLANDLLHDEENDYGWTGDELLDELKKACKKVVNGKLELVEDIFEEQRPIVPLGAFKETNEHKSYSDIAITKENSIIFSMHEKSWGRLENEHTTEGMFILNKYFLAHWINQGAIFLLVTNPNYFFTPPTKDENPNIDFGNYYRKELKYIYSRGYRWECLLPNDLLINTAIPADRI